LQPENEWFNGGFVLILLLIQLIDFMARLLVLIVVVDAILSFFVNPYHPLRLALGRVINPLLNPIRQIIPPTGMFDFSPLVLIIAVEILASLLTNILKPLIF